MLVYESETLGVFSICIESKDEDRIHLTVKYHDYTNKILDSVSVLIDRKNNVVWMNNELDYYPELEKVIRETIFIQDKTKIFPIEYLGLKGEIEHLIRHYRTDDNVIDLNWKFPNIFCFFEIPQEKGYLKNLKKKGD